MTRTLWTFALLLPVVHATTLWIGPAGTGGNGNWSMASYWNPGVVPNGSSINVTISNAPTVQTIQLDTSVTVNALSLGSTTTLLGVGSNSLAASSISNAGTLEMTNSNSLSSGSLTNSTGATVYIGQNSTANLGTVSNSGTFETGNPLGGNTVNVTGTFNNNSGSNLLITGSGDVVNINALNNSGTIQIYGGSGSNTPTLNITGGGPGVTDAVAGSSYQIGGNFNVINGGVSSNALANLTSIEGTVALSNPSNTITPSGGMLTIASGGELGWGGVGATLTIQGNVNNAGNMQTYYAGSSATINVNGSLLNNGDLKLLGSDTLNVSGTLTDNGSINQQSGNAITTASFGNNSGNNTNLINGTLNITGGAGAFTMTSGALQINGTVNWINGGLGVTDIPANNAINLLGNSAFNVINSGVTSSALANLTSIEGSLSLVYSVSSSSPTALPIVSTPIGGTLSISSTGLLNLVGSTMTVNGNLTSAGDIEIALGDNATLNVTGTLTNQANGTINDYLIFSPINANQVINAGLIDLGSGALNITGSGTSYNSGTMILEAGDVTVSGNLENSNSIETATGGGLRASDFVVEGTFTNDDGSSFSLTISNGTGANQSDSANFGDLINGGSISGVAGTFIGAGTGTFSDTTGYQQLANATLEELLDSASSFGLITVGDGVSLDGTLDIVLENGFIPTAGESFVILAFNPGELEGTFSTINGLTFDGGLESWLINYDNAAGEVILTAQSNTSAPEPSSWLLMLAGVGAIWRIKKVRAR